MKNFHKILVQGSDRFLDYADKERLQRLVERHIELMENQDQQFRDLKYGNIAAFIFFAGIIWMFVSPKTYDNYSGLGNIVLGVCMFFGLPFSSIFQRPDKWESSKGIIEIQENLKLMGYAPFVMGNRVFKPDSNNGYNVFKNESFFDERYSYRHWVESNGLLKVGLFFKDHEWSIMAISTENMSETIDYIVGYLQKKNETPNQQRIANLSWQLQNNGVEVSIASASEQKNPIQG